jgi:hypothetical protein
MAVEPEVGEALLGFGLLTLGTRPAVLATVLGSALRTLRSHSALARKAQIDDISHEKKPLTHEEVRKSGTFLRAGY